MVKCLAVQKDDKTIIREYLALLKTAARVAKILHEISGLLVHMTILDEQRSSGQYILVKIN
jgi:hypothetical protein